MAGRNEGGTDERLAALAAENARLREALADAQAPRSGPAEAALRESEALLRAIGDATPDLIFAKDRACRLVYVNAATAATLGLTPEEAIGRDNEAICQTPEEARRLTENDRRILDSGEPEVVEEVFTSPNGTRRVFRSAKTPMRDAEGQVIGLAGVSTDITARKAAEEALRESEARFRAMADSAPAPVWVSNAEGVEFANRAYLDFAGRPIGEVTGAGWTSLVHPDDLPAILARRLAAWETKEPYTFEARFRRADGEWRLLHASCNPRGAGPAEFLGYVGLATDITDQRAAEDRLRDSETRYRVALSAGSLGAWSWDAASDLVTLSEEAAALFGVAAGPLAKWTDLAKLIAKEDAPRTGETIARAIEAGSDYSIEYRVNRPEGGRIWLNVVARPIYRDDGTLAGMIGAVGDVTARRDAEARLRELNETLEQRVAEEVARRAEAEEALRQAQKMETLGQLTGGVAHDFNNLLQIVRGNLEILARNLPDEPEKLRRATENALRGTERAAVLTQRLLAFSRRQPLAPKPLDLNRLVSGMSELLHRTLGETVAVETMLAEDLWRVEADPHQLENAILNLAVNARDAMPDGGPLTIETGNVATEGQVPGLAAGDYVRLTVADTGSGMDTATVERAFEPFFTTKDVGKGTGLGLSMVYGFVRQSGGHIAIASEPGRGTTVTLHFPRLARAAADGEEAPEAGSAPAGRPSETVLVCEDDPDVRAYSAEVLRELGYEVLEARDGAAALSLLEQKGPAIDLLLTDVVLPGGMSGAAVAEVARRIAPALPVLFTTGYARNAILPADGEDGTAVLTKPFTYADLASRVRTMLDARA